jgi:hypothetical protein
LETDLVNVDREERAVGNTALGDKKLAPLSLRFFQYQLALGLLHTGTVLMLAARALQALIYNTLPFVRFLMSTGTSGRIGCG